MSFIKGVFLSDVHMPDHVNLNPIMSYLKDFKPDVVILGGDIIDAQGLHGVDSMKASDVDMGNYHRDCRLLRSLLRMIIKAAPTTKIVYLEGNHENRYTRLTSKFKKVFDGLFDFNRDALRQEIPEGNHAWIPYGTYDSFFKVGDTVFIHGNIWPDNHAKAYALRHTPNKVVYGHLHHYQAYTTHRPGPHESPRYAVTAGCLARMDPDWKKGAAHQWVNGFISFTSEHGITVPTVHLIENGRFNIGAKVYK